MTTIQYQTGPRAGQQIASARAHSELSGEAIGSLPAEQI